MSAEAATGGVSSFVLISSAILRTQSSSFSTLITTRQPWVSKIILFIHWDVEIDIWWYIPIERWLQMCADEYSIIELFCTNFPMLKATPRRNMSTEHRSDVKIHFVKGVFSCNGHRKKKNISTPNQQQKVSYHYSWDDHKIFVRYRQWPGLAIAGESIF